MLTTRAGIARVALVYRLARIAGLRARITSGLALVAGIAWIATRLATRHARVTAVDISLLQVTATALVLVDVLDVHERRVLFVVAVDGGDARGDPFQIVAGAAIV